MTVFAARRDALRRLLVEKSLDALLVTDERNVTYLTGFTGDSSYLAVSRQSELLLSDRRYTQQLEEECPGLALAIRGPGTKMTEFTAEVAGKLGLKSLGIESDVMSVGAFEKMKAAPESDAARAHAKAWSKRCAKSRTRTRSQSCARRSASPSEPSP